jgi:hypothetical protein
VLILGDLSSLTPSDRIDYYNRVCRSLALNPLTMPFSYILFREGDGAPAKLSLYANKSCTEQLRKIHGVSIVPPFRKSIRDGIVTVEVDARDKTGRTDTASGSVPLFKYKDGKRIELEGRDLCNADMKCETKAKRRVTLSICGLAFLDETELDTMDIVGGVTREGRIYYHQGQEPQYRGLPSPEAAQESAEAITALKAKGLWCEEHQCTRSASHLKECESSRVAQNGKEGVPGAAWKREADARADMPPIDVKPSQASPASRPNTSGKVPESEYKNENAPPATKPEPWKYNGQVEIDFSNEVWPIIRGDLSQIAEELKKACPTMDWGKDEFYHIQQRDLERLKQTCLQLNYQVKEIFPKPSKSAETKPATKTKPAKQDSPGTRLAKGTITRVISGMTGKNNPLRNVTMLLPDKRKPTFSCFDTGLFEWLDKGNGKEAELYVQTRGKYTNIIGIKRCAGKEFDTDGKTPVIQRKDQEAGGKTLFG